jgi:hypothetical protein
LKVAKSNPESLIRNPVLFNDNVYFALFKALGFNNAGYFFRNDRKHIGYVLLNKAIILFLRSYGYTYQDLKNYLKHSPSNYDFKTNRKSDFFFQLWKKQSGDLKEKGILEGFEMLKLLYNDLMDAVGVMNGKFILCKPTLMSVIRKLLDNYNDFIDALELKPWDLRKGDSRFLKRKELTGISEEGYQFALVCLLYRAFYYNEEDIAAILNARNWNVKMCLRKALYLPNMATDLLQLYHQVLNFCKNRKQKIEQDFQYKFLHSS